MPRTIEQLKAVLGNQQGSLPDVRQAALELAEHLGILDQRLCAFDKWAQKLDIHTHFFAIVDTNGNQREMQRGTAVALPTKTLDTGLALNPNVGVGTPVGLTRPRSDM